MHPPGLCSLPTPLCPLRSSKRNLFEEGRAENRRSKQTARLGDGNPTVRSRNPTDMGLSSLPTPSESVLTLVLVNTAITVSILKELLRSALHLLRLRATPRPQPQPALAAPGPPEPSLADRFRSQSSRIRFGSALGVRRPASADCRVCLARFEAESVVNRLPCGHLFHAACLETWLDYRHTTCPLCRTHVLREERPAVPSSSFLSWL